jgi:hypothetical protein
MSQIEFETMVDQDVILQPEPIRRSAHDTTAKSSPC